MLVAVTFNGKYSGVPAYLHDDLLHDYQPIKLPYNLKILYKTKFSNRHCEITKL